MRYSKDSVTFSETPDHLNVFRPVTRSSQDTPLIAQFVIHCTPSPCRGDLTSLSACCCCCCCCCLDFLSSSSSWASDSATRNAHTIMLNATEGAGGFGCVQQQGAIKCTDTNKWLKRRNSDNISKFIQILKDLLSRLLSWESSRLLFRRCCVRISASTSAALTVSYCVVFLRTSRLLPRYYFDYTPTTWFQILYSCSPFWLK